LFKNLGNLGSLLGQAQQMGDKMESLKAELRSQRITGNAGGGMVLVEINGAMEMLSVKLDPMLVAQSELEMLEDLIPAAVNDAMQKAKENHAKRLHSITGDLNLPIPGIQDAIAKLAGLEAEFESEPDDEATDPFENP
jgi:DNA-binding YbaB/EbfC family protein